MIVVGGFNTSLDRLVDVDDALVAGQVIRARAVQAAPGGKGVHVALTAAALGEPVQLVGIIDESHKPVFAATLEARGVAFDAVTVSGEIRTCLAIRHARGETTEITEILEPGPMLTDGEGEQLLARFSAAAARGSGSGDVAILTGSLPGNLPDGTYRELAGKLRAGGVRCFVDASGPLLREALAGTPSLIKPNQAETRALTGLPVGDPETAAVAARALGRQGVETVVVSLGAAGAVACRGDRVCHAAAPSVTAANPVGYGDCLLGGLAVGTARGWAFEDVLRLGVACGTANAVRRETGVIRRADVEALLPAVSLRWLT